MKKIATLFVMVLVFNFAKAQTIWSEDFNTFGAGLPAGWTNVGTPAAALWTYDTNGSNGYYAGTTGPIQSPTGSGGFMIFDSDFLDNGNTATQGSGAAPSPHTGTLTTPSFSTIGYSVVHLDFYQFYRNFQATTTVGCSVDGGVTWTDFPINSNVAVNTATANNDMVTVNLTGVAANQANVKLRFVFSGDYYFWQIDDISVYSVPAAHDLSLTNVYDCEYSMVPQIHTDTITYAAEFSNPGDYAETNVTVGVNTNLGASSVFTGVSTALGTLNIMKDSSALVTTPTFQPTQKGNYQTTFALSYANVGSDATTANNSATYSYVVTDTTYAYDDGAIDNGYYLYNPAATAPVDRVLGNTYFLSVDDTITYIGCYMYGGTNGTATNTQIQGVVYQFDGVGAYTEVCRTNIKTLAASDMSTPTALKLLKLKMDPTTGSPNLIAGTYFIAIQQLLLTKAVLASSLASRWSRILTFDPADNKVKYYAGTEGSSVMVRGYFGKPQVVGISNVVEEVVAPAYPNPAKVGDNLNVPVSSKLNNFTVNVYNSIGQQVRSMQFTAPSNKISINTAGLTEGNYNYTIEASNTKTTAGKFTLVK